MHHIACSLLTMGFKVQTHVHSTASDLKSPPFTIQAKQLHLVEILFK